MDPRKLGPSSPAVGIAGALAKASGERPPQPGTWKHAVATNPGHSAWYVERFRTMAAAGADLVGEARTIDAMAPRAATILDAGCGPGRHAGHLHRAGHTVVGLDLDPVLIAAAETDEPGPRYVVGDLADLALPGDVPASYDLIYSAGNVLTFLAADERRPALSGLAALLKRGGRLVVGFGLLRGYPRDAFEADAAASGLVVEQRWSTWDLRPLADDSDFLVAALTRA